MEIRKTIDANGVTIFLEGRFTFDDRKNFHEIAFLFPEENVTNIVVDFERLEYIDSTGVGMLLIMHENAQKRGIKVRAINVGHYVEPVFKQSALGNLFKVAYKKDQEQQ